MLLSMTGYGKSKAKTSKGEFLIEIKSYNFRFLDVSIKAPKFLLSKEFEIRELCKEYLHRGKVYLSVETNSEFSSNTDFDFDFEKAKYVSEKLKELKNVANYKSKIKLRDLLYFSTYYITDNSEINEEDFLTIKDGIASALLDLNEMRKKEGEKLKTDLSERINAIKEKIEVIQTLNANLAKEYFEKLKERTFKLTEEIAQISPERLELEIALLSDKIDITEELVRLQSHAVFFIETLNNGQEAGKRLNFIAQELNREINTIASKTISFEISKNVVFIKEEIEKIREQIQNIE